jgi:AraC family transcriptional regulator, positive regulator of tynA and feaB
MRKLFSTTDVHPRNRFEYWHDVACQNIVTTDNAPERRLAFEAEMQTGSLAEISLISFKMSPMEAVRTAHHAARATDDRLLCFRPLSGQLMVEQNGREVMLEAGDVTLLDPLLPYTAKYPAPTSALILKIPRVALEARAGKTLQMVARSLKSSEGEGALTSSFLAMLPDHADRMPPATAEIVSSQTLDLIALSLTHMMGAGRPKVSSSHALSLMRVRAAIETRLPDPTLDPAAVAAGAGISVRHANAVLSREGTSITRLIQTRRLARCRRALEDQSQVHRTVSEIAYGWGFSDITHFGRRFREAFGMLPSEFRASVKGRRCGYMGGDFSPTQKTSTPAF